MAYIEITVQPRAGVSRHDTVVELDRRRFAFSFYTNRVDNAWCFDIVGAVSGIALANGPNLLAPYRHLGLLVPPGQLWIVDKALDGLDPDELAFIEGRAALAYKGVAT